MVLTRCSLIHVKDIQRWYRNISSHAHERCPISFLHIPFNRRFILIEPNGATHCFDCSFLGRFIESTGQFINPITRRELMAVELLRLEHVTNIPLYTNMYQLVQTRHLVTNRDDLCSFLERETVGLVTTFIAYLTEYERNSTVTAERTQRPSRTISLFLQRVTAHAARRRTPVRSIPDEVARLVDDTSDERDTTRDVVFMESLLPPRPQFPTRQPQFPTLQPRQNPPLPPPRTTIQLPPPPLPPPPLPPRQRSSSDGVNRVTIRRETRRRPPPRCPWASDIV